MLSGHDRGQWRYSVVQNFWMARLATKGFTAPGLGDLYLFDRGFARGQVVETIINGLTGLCRPRKPDHARPL